MKDYLKNPLFYYAAIPAVAGLWALTAGMVLYPRAMTRWDQKQDEFNTAQGHLIELIGIEPQRLAHKQESGIEGDFDFTHVINEFATLFSIPPANYTLNTSGESRRAGKRARSASLGIREIDVEKLSMFLSTLLMRWPDLQCEVLNLDKLPQGKNIWRVDMRLTYYY